MLKLFSVISLASSLVAAQALLPLGAGAESESNQLSNSASAKSRGSATGLNKLTLEQSYKLALERSDTLRIQEEQVKLAQAKYDEAFGQILPNLHVVAAERLQDTRGQIAQTNNDGSFTPGSTNYSGRSRFQTYLSVSQPIFQGFRDWYTISAYKADITTQDYNLARRHQILYQDCAEVFYQILMFQGDLSELEVTKRIGNERIEELKRFVQLGRSRDAEILAVQSDLADLDSRTEQILGFLAASKELLAFLTGLPSATLNLVDDGKHLLSTPTLDVLIAQSESRPDLLAVKSGQTSAQELVKAAKAERWPAISFQGNAYPVENPDSEHDWDVMFKADMPIFEGGAIAARVRQQEAIARASTYQISELKRTIEREVRTAHSDLEATRAQLAALDRLVAAAKLNYSSQSEDYKRGVVTNIDVLQAIKQMQEARLRLHDARMAAQINMVRLSVAAGVIPQ